jgi:inner membrane protein
MLWGMDTSLYFRRGWTHGILALILLPLLLAGGIWLFHRWRGCCGGGGAPFHIGKTVGLSYLAVLSHPMLDWLNTYGVRLLMPFDGRWFYGDTLFVVDPWFWLLMAAGVVLARSQGSLSIAVWLLFAGVATVLILFTDITSVTVKLLWLIGLAVIILLRWKKPGEELTRNIARGCVVFLVVYVSTAYGLARMAETFVAERHPDALVIQANPVPAVPFAHRIVEVYQNMYLIIRIDGSTLDVLRKEPDRVVRAALNDPSIRGFSNWMRHPYWEVVEMNDGWAVTFYDLRYSEPGQAPIGIGQASVFVRRQAVLDHD